MRRTVATAEIMQILVNAPAGDISGYEIMKATGRKSGTIYQALRKLEGYGLIHRDRVASRHTGKPDQYRYRLTGAAARAEMLSYIAEVEARHGKLAWVQ